MGLKKYRVYLRANNFEDTVELDDSLTEDEIEAELMEYVFDGIDWGYEEIKHEDKDC